MYIFYSEESEPMLLDSVDGLSAIRTELLVYLSSNAQSVEFRANTDSDPQPYDRLLNGFRVTRASGVSELFIDNDSWLSIIADDDKILDLVECMFIVEDCSHNHWRSISSSLIIEADNWRASQ